MLRTLAKKHYLGMASTFRYRGEEPSRIEALSDSCFALAIGLLLISTKSPDTFEELFDFTRDLIPVALCLTMIMLVWHQHFIFFIRYGFRNARLAPGQGSTPTRRRAGFRLSRVTRTSPRLEASDIQAHNAAS
jgi:hypothetical protein